MTAYYVFAIKVTDPEGYKAYAAAVPAITAKYGGRYLVRGGNPLYLEGKWDCDRIVVSEFKDKTAALAWYHSPEYQAIIHGRIGNSIGTAVLVEGVPPG